jgi:hypothetical protein
MGNIVGESLRKYVVQQINARQTLHGSGVFKPSKGNSSSDFSLEDFNRTDAQINILNSNTSWIKLASGVYLEGAEGSKRLKDIGFLDIEIPNLIGDGLAKNFILYGGTSTLETNQNGNLVTTQRQGFLENFGSNSSYMYSYTPSNITVTNPLTGKPQTTQYKSADFGYSPMPGIISAEIKSLNRGSLEKAFIKIKANDRRQLDILDILYMRLGYTVLLEWGNSLYTKTGTDRENVRQTLIEKKFFQVGKNRSYFDFLGYGGTQLIDQERARYDGNYDGMLAVVSNFSWVFNPDGTYDIDLTLISMGDVVESLKSNVSIDSKLKGFIKNSPELSTASPGSEESPIEKNKDANIITSALWLFKRFGPNASQKVNIVLGNGDTKNVGNLLKNGPSELSVYSNTYKLEYRTKDGFEIDPSIGSTTISDNIGDLKTNSTITINSAFPDDEADNKLRELYNDPKTYKGDQPEQNPPINKASKSKHTIKISYRIEEDTTVSTGGYGSTTLTSISDRGKHVAVQWTKVSSTTTSTFENPIDSAHYDDACVINNTTQQYYLRFGYLLQFLTEKVIPLIKSDNDPPLFDIDFSTWSNHMYSLPNQISLDPRVCIVKNLDFKKAEGKGTAKVFEKLRQFKENDNKNAAYPMNIYLNFEFIISSLESNTNDRGDVNLYGFVSSICTGLNKALGGINNLEPIIDKDENVLRILDSTPIPGYSCPALSDTNKYELNLFGYKKEGTKNNINLYSSTFVRKIDLKTAITPEYATMVTVGATANGYVKGTEATAFSRWNLGIVDRFKDELVSPNPVTQTQTSGQDEPEYNYVNEFLNKVAACYGYDGDLSSSDNPGDINSDIVEQNLSIVTEFYKYIIAKAGQKTQQAGTIGFIPFKLGITMDGISGIKIYNKLEVNSRFLPTKYGDTLNFIITGVSHRLQNNDWETVLETIVMPKTSPISLFDINFKAVNFTPEASSKRVTSCNQIPNSTAAKRIVKAKDNTYAKAIGYVINNLEGGYFHPVHAFRKDKKGNIIFNSGFDYRTKDNPNQGNSGETLWGIDRPNGEHVKSLDPKIKNAGIKFWNKVDELSGYGLYKSQNQTVRKYDWNISKYPKKSGAWSWLYNPGFTPGTVLADNAQIIIVNGFEKNMNTYFGSHPLYNIVKSDGRLLFLYFRAWWNGPQFFKNFSKNLKSKYDSGITNVDDLICADLTYRYNYISEDFWKTGISKMKDLIDFNSDFNLDFGFAGGGASGTF